jgi:MSHA pilin protein MshC
VSFPNPIARGFTLIELVVVMVIASVLAAYAASQINTQGFDALGFADQTAAMLRYAQKAAISQRRTVAVVISSSQVKLCYTDSACSGGSVSQPLGSGSGAFVENANSGVSVSGTSFTFNALGQASIGQTITITGSGGFSRQITVVQETGYVN